MITTLLLGTFLLAAPTTNACPTGATCYNFTVAIPNVPYNATGELAVRTPSGTVQATDVFFSLEAGNGWWGGQPNPTPLVATFFNSLLAQGHQIVLIRWNGSWYFTPPGTNLGWKTAACRPATVMQWVKDHYPSPSFNVIGTSNGGAAVTYALGFYGVTMDKAVVDSGPPQLAIRKACEPYPGYEFNLKDKGIIDVPFGNHACVNGDTSFESQWDANSVENGGVYSYPTEVHVIYGLKDEPFIQNRARDYATLLGLTSDEVHVIAGMGHGAMGSRLGLNTIYGILTQ